MGHSPSEQGLAGARRSIQQNAYIDIDIYIYRIFISAQMIIMKRRQNIITAIR
jgi:hypothetical protein